MPRGGKRPGAGTKKGRLWKSTLSKIEAREEARAIITKAIGPILQAQIAHAQGIKYLVIRHKASGKFLRVGEQAAKNHDPETEVVEVWEKDPSAQAFAELMDRALDKAPNSVAVTGANGGPLTVKWEA